MTDDLTIRFATARTPEEAYDAVVDVRSWWTGDITGDTDRVGAAFTYAVADVHRSVQEVTALDRGRLVVWSVTDARLSFVADPAEWIGSEIRFAIAPLADGSEIVFTHVGLSAALECFESCSDAWRWYVGTSLRQRIATGHGA
jgi:hypothetical protein